MYTSNIHACTHRFGTYTAFVSCIGTAPHKRVFKPSLSLGKTCFLLTTSTKTRGKTYAVDDTDRNFSNLMDVASSAQGKHPCVLLLIERSKIHRIKDLQTHQCVWRCNDPQRHDADPSRVLAHEIYLHLPSSVVCRGECRSVILMRPVRDFSRHVIHVSM